jgi:phospholipid-binding lipoprotein MlaA
MKKLITLFLAMNFAISCVPNDIEKTEKQDPYEKINRQVFAFNRSFDKTFLTPMAKTYQVIVPKMLSKCISHAFLNLEEINTIANDLLQLRLIYAAEDSWRFIINSTLGLGGCFDIAENFDLEKRPQSFGITLKTWGLGNGSYIVIPFLGASTTMNSPGLFLKFYVFDPIRFINDNQFVVQTVRVLDKRAQLFPLDAAIDNAFDPYILYKEAYLQNQAQNFKKINQ